MTVIAVVAAVGWWLTSRTSASTWVATPVAGGQSTSPGPSTGPTASGPSSPTPSPTQRHTPVKVAIFGDSQATALYTTRPQKSVDKMLKLSNESISACGIMRGRVVSRSGEHFDLIGACPNWLSAWRTKAKQARADIALVVIGAWDVFDVQAKTSTLKFGTAEWDTAFLGQLRAGVAAIRESGSQVALAELPCYRPRKTNPRPPGYWPERGDDSRTRHVNDLLRQVADGVHVFTVQPPSSFCADASIGDNHKYRYDGTHYLQPGAKLWFDAVIPQLLTLPG
ncbi:MAG TPA: SGNH hydrolase domain-containing protein [Micromonosporaceae bacterium]|nr:SGNH hydrolase domain-containing protein [Micromonosporaceae bacterium]